MTLLFFGDADAELLTYIRSVILYFKAVLCLRVNLSHWDVGETEELTGLPVVKWGS